MSAASYFAGLLLFAGVWGGAAVAGILVVRRRLPDLRGAARALAWAIVTTAAIIASTLLPAATGTLSRGTALISALALAFVAWRLPRAEPSTPSGFPGPATGARAGDWALAALGVGGFLIWVVVAAAQHRTAAPSGFDAVSAYLPTAARWIQTGSIWHVSDWVPNAFYGSGPGNGGAIVASAILPWHDDFVARFAIYPFVVLTAGAIYALGRELRSPPPAAALLAVMLTSIPVIVQPGLVDGLLDPVMYFTFAAGLTFGIRHHRTGARSDLVLAALALGIAFGTKYYGYTTVAATVAVWAGARLLAGTRPLRVARETGVAGGIILAAGGIWMLRDWIAAGNPLLPVKVHLLGLTVFDAPADPLRPKLGATLASYLDQPSVWTQYLAHQFRIGAALPLLLLTIAVVAAVVALVAKRGRRLPLAGVAWTLVALTVALATAYALTPYSAPGPPGKPYAAVINIRYGVPAMIAATAVAAWLVTRAGPRLILAIEVLAIVGTVDALRVGTTTLPGVVYASFAVAGVAVAVGWLARRSMGRAPPMRARWLVGAATIVLIGLGIAGKPLTDDYDAARYRQVDPAIDWVIAHSGDGTRVALAGVWTAQGIAPTYPSFGPRLQNTVDYLGPKHEGLLRTYRAARGFRRALAAGRYPVIVIGRTRHLGLGAAREALYSGTAPPALRLPPEERWARSLGYRAVSRSRRFVVMTRDTTRPAS